MNVLIYKQTGAALVVGLIVLLVMTLLGVSSMNITTTELKISNNSQFKNTCFQASAAMLQLALADPLIDYTDITPGNVQTVDNTGINLTNATASASVTFVDCRLSPPGYGLTGKNPMKGVIHEITSVGQTLAVTEIISSCTQVMGTQTVRPGC